jgi:hypothetical protein
VGEASSVARRRGVADRIPGGGRVISVASLRCRDRALLATGDEKMVRVYLVAGTAELRDTG